VCVSYLGQRSGEQVLRGDQRILGSFLSAAVRSSGSEQNGSQKQIYAVKNNSPAFDKEVDQRNRALLQVSIEPSDSQLELWNGPKCRLADSTKPCYKNLSAGISGRTLTNQRNVSGRRGGESRPNRAIAEARRIRGTKFPTDDTSWW
jgi:hypothetical protein